MSESGASARPTVHETVACYLVLLRRAPSAAWRGMGAVGTIAFVVALAVAVTSPRWAQLWPDWEWDGLSPRVTAWLFVTILVLVLMRDNVAIHREAAVEANGRLSVERILQRESQGDHKIVNLICDAVNHVAARTDKIRPDDVVHGFDVNGFAARNWTRGLGWIVVRDTKWLGWTRPDGTIQIGGPYCVQCRNELTGIAEPCPHCSRMPAPGNVTDTELRDRVIARFLDVGATPRSLD